MNGVGYMSHGTGGLDPEHWTNRRDEPEYTIMCDVCNHLTIAHATEQIYGYYVCLDCFDRWNDPNNKNNFVQSVDVINSFVDYMMELGALDEYIKHNICDYACYLSKGAK